METDGVEGEGGKDRRGEEKGGDSLNPACVKILLLRYGGIFYDHCIATVLPSVHRVLVAEF